MSDTVLLVGILAQPDMLDVFGLTGAPESLPGGLTGGARAGIDRDAWPRLAAGQGTVAAMRVVPNAALTRYAAVMGLMAQDGILGLGHGTAEGEPQPRWPQPLHVISWRYPPAGPQMTLPRGCR